MIYVDKIPDGCVCGWLAMSNDPAGTWRLARPEPMCHYLDHHAKESYIQLGLDEQPEWEVEK